MPSVRKRKTNGPKRPNSESDNISTHTPKSKKAAMATATVPPTTSKTSAITSPRARYRTNTKVQNRPTPGRLHPIHIRELWSIWIDDPRVPTITSRNAWAKARNIDGIHVHRWFSSRKYQLKKQKIQDGLTVSHETYDLPIGTPPIVKLEEEEEEEFSSLSYVPIKMEEEESSDEDTSDYRLSSPSSTIFDSDPHTASDYTSGPSDTACSSPAPTSPEISRKHAYIPKRTDAMQTTNTDPIYLTYIKPSSEHSTIKKLTTPLFVPDPSQPLCSQADESSASNFLCLLCTRSPGTIHQML